MKAEQLLRVYEDAEKQAAASGAGGLWHAAALLAVRDAVMEEVEERIAAAENLLDGACKMVQMACPEELAHPESHHPLLAWIGRWNEYRRKWWDAAAAIRAKKGKPWPTLN